LRVARVTLNNTMGITVAPDYYVIDNLTFKKYEIEFVKALEMAYSNRPDLRSVIAKKEAAGESIELVKKDYYPSLSGNASYNWSGEKVSSLDSGWTVGATLTFPIFSGFLTQYQVEESKANLNVLKANEESLRQGVFLEVQQAYLNLQDAEERIPTAELAVRQAEENLDIANGRYIAGVGNPIEVTDAQVAYTSAKTAYIQALYDYKVAQSSLEKAMGVK
ncbi:MAG: TolC family protein, partial [Nitrospirae bacterium]|nr:TolC family protein [Nitrospirota bacterium]